MYANCIFCNSDLGRNEAVENFPVGRRLAYDPAKGRLWVVCAKCERWNLSPLEERWEAIEEAERFYRDTRQRVSTENIGLARLKEGTELVRIGEPQRPEFAAWRYGDQFGRRRRRQLILTAGGLGVLGAAVAGGAMAGVAVAVFGGAIGQGMNAIIHGRSNQIVTHIRTGDDSTLAVRRRHLAETTLERGTDAPLAIELRYKNGQKRFEGREALRVAASVMPHVNRFGGKREAVQSAVGALEAAGGVNGFLEHLGSTVAKSTKVPVKSGTNRRKPIQSPWSGQYTSGLFGLSAPDRIALEMAVHEEAELRAMRGELAELEQAWRDAEAIASIADGMLMNPSLESRLDRLRQR